MRIFTDQEWRPFLYREEVPAEVLKQEFDYQNSEDALDGFFKYHDRWYHLDQFVCSGLSGWDGSLADSFFSGVVIRVSEDGEYYQVGTWME